MFDSVAESSAPPWDEQMDVVVVGMGAAGCAAAITAHDEGAAVCVLEKTSAEVAGGNTRVSGGAWFHHDDPERAAVYLQALSGDRPIPDAVTRAWAEDTRHISTWVESLGVATAKPGDFDVEYPELDGSDFYGGYRSVDGVLGNEVLYKALDKAVRDRGIPVYYRQRAIGLVTAPNGTVLGVRTEDGQHIGARRGVVLATGGFEGNPELVRKHLGLHDVPVWGSTAATGDGLQMGAAVGADTWHMDNMMAVNGIPVPGSRHACFASFDHAKGFLWVNDDGERFTDENVFAGHGQALIDGRLRLHPDRPMHVVFDERTRCAGPISPGPDVLAVGWQLLMEGYRWSADNSAEIEAGWIHAADTLPELAALTGVPTDALVAAVEEYNAACAKGVDDRFHRDPSSLVPVDQPPYYCYRAGPVLAWTNGGLRRDEHARVLDRSGSAVPGLYAAGTVSSTYSWGKDGGFHIADALVFGRRAGSHAAARG